MAVSASPSSVRSASVRCGLRAELKRLRAGGIEVDGVRLRERRARSGRTTLYVALALKEPAPGERSWPPGDLWLLRWLARETLDEHLPYPDVPWRLKIEDGRAKRWS